MLSYPYRPSRSPTRPMRKPRTPARRADRLPPPPGRANVRAAVVLRRADPCAAIGQAGARGPASGNFPPCNPLIRPTTPRETAQRARALIRRPRLLLCDEPTGNLDEASAEMVAALLLELHRRQETILIVVTHNSPLAARFPKRYELRHANLHPAGA